MSRRVDLTLSPLRSLQLSQIEHILKRPDSYIGSVQHITQMMWVFDYENKKMVHKCVAPTELRLSGGGADLSVSPLLRVLREITFVPGFFKIFDEILVNAADNKVRFAQN